MVKPRYKQTEIGVIPEDWKVCKWEDVGSCFSSGATPYRAISQYYDGDIKWVTSGELNYNTITETREHISEEAQRKTNLTLHPANTFLMAITGLEAAGTRGSCAILGVPATTNQSCLAVYGTDKLDVRYLFYYYSSNGGSLAFTYCQGTKQQSYTAKIVKKLPIILPPIAEQKQIAETLSETDHLIEVLEKQIKKKKAIKQGAMQELLTGKRRLPGFSGRWISQRWKDVLDCFSSGATPYRRNTSFYNGSIKWVSSGELNYNHIMDTLEHISPEAMAKANLTMHPAGTFLMAITGLEAAGTRGSCALLGTPATTNQSCMAIYGTDKMSTEYLFHYYVQHGDELAFQYCQGTKQQSYTAAIVRELPIYYPEDIEEQKNIATLLTTMNEEIKVLEQKLQKYRQVKQAMMQQLLTGKIRLV